MNPKLIRTLDALQLEMAFNLAVLDKDMHLAATIIAACWKGIKTRRSLRAVRKKRIWAIWTLQAFIVRKMATLRKRRAQREAALLLQKHMKGYLVLKRYFKEISRINIDNTLSHFSVMKAQVGAQMSNMIRFLWRVR